MWAIRLSREQDKHEDGDVEGDGGRERDEDVHVLPAISGGSTRPRLWPGPTLTMRSTAGRPLIAVGLSAIAWPLPTDRPPEPNANVMLKIVNNAIR